MRDIAKKTIEARAKWVELTRKADSLGLSDKVDLCSPSSYATYVGYNKSIKSLLKYLEDVGITDLTLKGK